MSKPPARVRQSVAGDSGIPRPVRLKIRAFDEWFWRGNGVTPLQMTGRCLPKAFVVSVTGCGQITLAGRMESDREGAYAVVECQQHPLPFGLALKVEVEATDAVGDLACISCYELPTDLAAQREVSFANRWYSVSFNPCGHVDGVATGCPQSLGYAPPCA